MEKEVTVTISLERFNQLEEFEKVAKFEIVTSDEYIKILELLLSEREKVLHEIPECPIHGKNCVPHAIEWIKIKK